MFEDLDPRWMSVIVSTISVIVTILLAIASPLIRSKHERKKK